MRGRPSLGYALLVALVGATTTWAALIAWRGFLTESRDYLAPLLIIALCIGAAGAVLRWLGSPAVVTVLAQLLLAVTMVSSELGGGPIPLGGTGDEVWRSLELAVDSARTYAAPIRPDVPSVAPMLLVGGVFFVLLVDFLACTLRRVPVAGLALLAVYSVPAGLVQTGPGWMAFLLASVGFLALLHLDSREQLLKWGRPLGPDEHNPWTDANPLADAMRVGAGRIGAAATACALLLPPFIPVLDLDLLGLGPGDGNEDIEIHNPRTDLRRDLEQGPDRPLVRVRTDDPDPDYLRVAVLNRFTGEEWSSGDRGVADYDTASGSLPEPEGLTASVPRTTYQYEFEATEQFDSSWLPTPFPASYVEADGDWRFDPDTMDFIAVPDDLTTEGLDWTATGMEPDYGTTGEFFTDSAIDAVDDEFLEVPDLPAIVRSQAFAATQGARSDYEAAVWLQDWFRETGGFRYSLERAPEGMGGNAFETFLSDEPGGRTGYCEQFASAMAVMARMVGIPARVAVGFLQPADLGNGEWEYSSRDLHAWPELYFEDAGWVRFEPTPHGRAEEVPDYSSVPVDRGPIDLPTNQPESEDPSRGETAEPTQVTTTVAPEDQSGGAGGSDDEGLGWRTLLLRVGLGALVLALLVGLALVPRFMRDRQRRRRLAGTPEDLWDELRATTVDLELVWPSGRSPQEIGRALVSQLGDRADPDSPERPRTGADADPDATAALERIVAALELARYARSGAALPAADLADDTLVCCASLEAGVARTAALRAKWLPRSVWQRTPRTAAGRAGLAGA